MADHRRHHGVWQSIDRVQYAVDTKPYAPLWQAWLETNIASALFESKLQQPLDELDHVLIVGSETVAITNL